MIMTDERFMAFMISKCSILKMKDPKSVIRVLKISILRFDIDLDNVAGDLLSHMPTIMLAFHHLSRNCTKSYWVTWLLQYVKSKSIPFSTAEEVGFCWECDELKPWFASW